MDPSILAVVAIVGVVSIMGMFSLAVYQAYSHGFTAGENQSDKENAEAMLLLERKQLKDIMESRERIRASRLKIANERPSETVSDVFGSGLPGNIPTPD